ncbi:hypothetical protein Tco_1027383 [Tanacetum coccineum]
MVQVSGEDDGNESDNGGNEYDDLYLTQGGEGGAAIHRAMATLADTGRVYGVCTVFFAVTRYSRWEVTHRVGAGSIGGVEVT